jgi:hypothetical protein
MMGRQNQLLLPRMDHQPVLGLMAVALVFFERSRMLYIALYTIPQYFFFNFCLILGIQYSHLISLSIFNPLRCMLSVLCRSHTISFVT